VSISHTFFTPRNNNKKFKSSSISSTKTVLLNFTLDLLVHSNRIAIHHPCIQENTLVVEVIESIPQSDTKDRTIDNLHSSSIAELVNSLAENPLRVSFFVKP